MRVATSSVFALLALAQLACSSAPGPVDRHFRLGAPEPSTVLVTPGIAGTLIVDRPRGDALLVQRPIVYRRHVDTAELAQYPYALWVDAPTAMVQHGMALHLTSAGVATEVVTSDLGVEGDYMLRARLLRLEHVRGEHPGVELELELFLTRRDTGTLVLEGRYAAARKLESDELAPVVHALRDALGDALDDFVSDVAQHTATDGVLVPLPAKRAP